MSDILHYIVEHPFFCIILLGVVVLACGLAPFSSSSTENKRSAIINKHYNDTFKKQEGLMQSESRYQRQAKACLFCIIEGNDQFFYNHK